MAIIIVAHGVSIPMQDYLSASPAEELRYARYEIGTLYIPLPVLPQNAVWPTIGIRAADLISHAHTRERQTRSAPDADWVRRDDGTGVTGICSVDCIVGAWANDAHPRPLGEPQPTKYEAGR
ncbi:hypothetical protein ASPTUDRAFT_187627 [Aspergillus tubingensis CBS 134.48]|uniref:Uncharacterized protein n=1 Tax=Aspergillus tubingensis (strain CBS 134.48) TaxID=767770 RepID=A0A1L9NAA2_ASPTC|nr:hypothetical protein ASPTUDRAFT_187627 [Aspergillus tubingensis CBS 134.48]